MTVSPPKYNDIGILSIYKLSNEYNNAYYKNDDGSFYYNVYDFNNNKTQDPWEVTASRDLEGNNRHQENIQSPYMYSQLAITLSVLGDGMGKAGGQADGKLDESEYNILMTRLNYSFPNEEEKYQFLNGLSNKTYLEALGSGRQNFDYYTKVRQVIKDTNKYDYKNQAGKWQNAGEITVQDLVEYNNNTVFPSGKRY